MDSRGEWGGAPLPPFPLPGRAERARVCSDKWHINGAPGQGEARLPDAGGLPTGRGLAPSLSGRAGVFPTGWGLLLPVWKVGALPGGWSPPPHLSSCPGLWGPRAGPSRGSKLACWGSAELGP